MAFFKYNEVDVLIDGSGVAAESATISAENGLSPVIILGRKGNQGQFPDSPFIGDINLSYLLQTTFDAPYNFVNSLRTSHQTTTYAPHTVVVGGITGEGYLSNFSFQATPNNPVYARASYRVFNQFSGFLERKRGNINYLPFGASGIAHGYSLFITSTGNYSTVPTYQFDYSFDAEWEPVYVIGSVFPRQVQFMGAKESFRLVRDNYTGLLYSGSYATGYFNFGNQSNISGIGLGQLGTPTYNAILVFDISGAQVKNHSVEVQSEDFIRITTEATNYY